MEKTIKYLENGEYHYATVRSVGDLAELKTDSKETLVEAINELWNGGGNADPSKAPKPEGYDQLVQDVADAVKNQQEINQQWTEWQKEDAQLTEERKQAYLQAMKEMQESIDKAKADAAALDKKLQKGVDTLNNKTSKLDEEITKTFSDLDTSIQNMHEQLQKEADRMNQELINTKSDLTRVRTDLQNAQLDNGKIHDELTNINGKFEHKVWQTDLDPLKAQIDRAETSVQQTKDELLGKASREDLDTVTNAVSKLDTQLKETAKGVEISVKKDELGGEIAEALVNKTNLLLGTRRFTTNNWTQRDHVEICSDPWKGFLVAKQNSPIEGIQQAYDVKAGTTYTFSLFAKMDNLGDSNKPQIILAKNNLDTSLNTKIDVWRKEIDDITSDFKRYDLTFTPSEDCTIYPHVISNSNNPIFVCGYQLEIGKELTPWEPNQEDVGDYVEKSEAQFNVYNDKIQALTEKQRQQGDTQEKLRTEVTQTAEGVKQVSESLKNTNGDITKLRGDLERTADHMKSEYESYTNKAVGQISDSTLNLIRNSSFQNKDEDFAQWQNVSSKANVRQDENGLRWVELTQSGLTTDNPQGITSNYFNVKQGKVTVAVDIKAGDKATLDNESVLFLEFYNDAKKRVDFRFVTLSELGLSKNLLDDHKVHRGLYRLGIDRNDAKYMTVKAHLMRNGDLYFTNFSARLSSIDDGAYEPNPDDLNQQILKQNTKIEQNAKEVAIKANSVDVTRDIKSAVDNVQVGGVNLVENGDANASNATPWPNTLCQNHDFYFNGTKKMFNLHTSSTNELISDCVNWFPIEAGQQYTLSFKGFMSWNVSSYDVWLLGRKVGTNGGWTNSFPIIGEQRLSSAHCETITKTLTAPSDWNNFEAYLRFDNNGSSDGNDSVFFFNEVKLEKGNKATSYSPAPGDTSKEIKSAKDAAIQVASDQINIHVNELTTSFDDKLNKRINEQKSASEKFTSDGIEQVVTKITNVKNDVDRLGDKVDGIQVGGVNLIKNSETDIVIESKTTDAWPAWKYEVVYYDLTPGETYTFSVSATNTNNVKDASIRIFNEAQNKEAPGNLVFPADGKRHSTTFTLPKDGVNYSVYLYAGHMGNIEGKDFVTTYHHPQLELGNKSTSWSPAPEDTFAEIKSAKEAAIKVASDKIDLQVQEITGKFNDKLNKSAVEIKSASEKFTTDGIEQTVTKITNVKNDVDRLGDTVSGVNGGINLVKGTSLDEKAGRAYLFASYTIPEGLQPGKTYTLSAWGKVDQDSLNHQQHVFIDPYVDDWSWATQIDIQASLDWKYVKSTFTIPSTAKVAHEVGVYLSHPDGGTNQNNDDSKSGLGWIKKVKIEKGTNATSWTPYESEQVTKSRVSGGGVNLLKLSSFRNITIDQLKSAWYVNPDAWINQNNSIVLNNKAGKHAVMDLSQTVQLEPDTDYVLSLHLIFAQMASGKEFGGETFIVEKDANGNSISPYKDNGAKMVNGDLRSQNTRVIHTSPNTHQGIVYLRALPGTQIEFNEVKLEKGQIGTPWSNAPDDVSTKQEVTATVKNLGDRVTTQVNSVETRVINVNDKVDNISVGGRNYISPKNIGVYYAHEPQYNNNTQEWSVVIDNGTGGSWGGGICFHDTGIVVPWGQAYTDSVEVYVTDPNLTWNVDTNNSSVAGASWSGNDNDNRSALTATPALNSVIPTNQWYRLSVTAWNTNPKNTNHVGINDFSGFGIINKTGHTITVKFRRPKQELGSKATDWSPNPDDTVEAIKEINTKWDVANGQIQGKVTATDVNNILNGKGYATQSWAQTMFQMKSDSITLQAVRDNITNGIQNQVNETSSRLNGMTAGGTNLLRGTSATPVVGDAPKSDWADMSSIYDTFASLDSNQYVLSFEARGDVDNQRIMSFLYHGGLGGTNIVNSSITSQGRRFTQNTDGASVFYLTTQWKRYWVVYDVSPDAARKQVIVGRRWAQSDGGNASGKVYIRKVKLERGNVATDWAPAPEDQGSGQNLLRGTADFSWPTGIGMNNRFEFNYERFDDSTIAMHLWNIQDSIAGIYTKWGGAFPDGQIQVGEQYTFSFDVKGSGKFQSVKNESEPEKGMLTLNGVNIPSEWARVSVTGTIQALDKAFIIYLAQGANVWIKNVQIERGAIATPWTPHPFDDKDKGVNLLKSTAYWNPADWNHISDNVWYDDNWVDNLGHKAYGHHTAWQGLGQTVYVTPGVYTWSAQIYLNGLDSNDSVYPYMGDSQYNGTVQVQDIRRPMLGVNDQNKWINYSTTFYVKNAGNLCVRPELNRDHGTIHVGSQKLEHGMVATPWSPSPLDDKNATITLDSADVNNMKTQGHYFVRNLANSPIVGWVYVDVTGNNNDRLKQEVYQDIGYEHRSRRWTGSGWTEWTTDVNNKNVISQINITPDQIKIASNKIVIDGNTDIHGDLRTDRVRLVGKQGLIDMTGDDGMRMANKNGSSILIGNGNIDLMYNNDFRMNIDSSMMTLLKKESALGQNNPIAIGSIGTSFYANDKRRGMQILYTPGKDDWSYRGADYLGLGYSLDNEGQQGQRKIYDQIELYRQDTTINGHLKRKGIHIQDNLHLGDGQQIYLENQNNNIQDPIRLEGRKFSASAQPEYFQPYITLGYSPTSISSAGLGINWWELIPNGRINSSYSYMSAHGTDGEDGLTVSWYSWPGWYGGRKAPSIVYKGKDGSLKNGGFVFYPGGEVCFWQGDFRSNFRWSGIKQTD